MDSTSKITDSFFQCCDGTQCRLHNFGDVSNYRLIGVCCNRKPWTGVVNAYLCFSGIMLVRYPTQTSLAHLLKLKAWSLSKVKGKHDARVAPKLRLEVSTMDQPLWELRTGNCGRNQQKLTCLNSPVGAVLGTVSTLLISNVLTNYQPAKEAFCIWFIKPRLYSKRRKLRRKRKGEVYRKSFQNANQVDQQ